MSLELIKEAVRLNEPIGEDSTQTIIENDIIVPDVKPDIARILLLDGDAYVSGTDIAADKLTAEVMVRYKILYISDDPEQRVKSINNTSSFQHVMNIPNVRKGMQSRVKCDIEHMEYEVVNSRKINIKTIVNLSAKVTDQVEQYIAQDFESGSGVQVLRNKVSVNSFIGCSNTPCTINENLELPAGKPPIAEILRSDVKISGKEVKLSDNKIVAQGQLNISTLYLSDDPEAGIQSLEHEVPFAQTIDMDDVDESMYFNTEFDLGEMAFNPEEDSDGELRQISCSVLMNMYTECFCKKDIDIIDDAYSPQSRLDLEKDEITVDTLSLENSSQITLKEMVDIDEDSPDISEIFNVIGKLSITDSSIEDDRIILEGVVDCNILYLADNEEQPVFCVQRDIPFRQAIEAKGANDSMNLNVETDIEHCSYSLISAKEVEVRIAIGMLARVSSKETIKVVSNATEQQLDSSRLDKQPSITIYFAQEGDTLWDIAKRYYTTVDQIIKDNDFENARELIAGEQIIIPKRF